jgi:tetratricopeptide (TPR) repeat protein
VVARMRGVVFRQYLVLGAFVVFSGVGCSKPLTTSTIATATGGAIGAGIGALIGSQTGSAGVGLAVGSAAGAGTGALIGNMFEKQEQLVAQRDEAFNANQRKIKSQQEEIETLRQLHGDVPPSGDGKSRFSKGGLPKGTAQLASNSGVVNGSVAIREIERRGAGLNRDGMAGESKTTLSQPLTEKTITASSSDDLVKTSAFKQESLDVGNTEVGNVRGSTEGGYSDGSAGGDCAQATTEIKSAREESRSKEKLFRYRRALRMCPDQASLHSELGELYLDMNRIHDAEYEFNEAMRLNPNDKKAKANLAELNG